jgi:hypothetical protein
MRGGCPWSQFRTNGASAPGRGQARRGAV